MSLLTAVILPHLEQYLINLEPKVADILLAELRIIGLDLINYVETKLHTNPKEIDDSLSDKKNDPNWGKVI
jgi:hypothetical protein